jgi:hypothetical protein
MAQKPEKPKSFKHEGVTEPETGIHVCPHMIRQVQLIRFLTSTQSQAWAKAIVPQHSLLLKLPIEIRIKIWEEVIDTFKNGYKLVTPWKNGKKFKSHWWADAAKETSALYEICR